jgi:DNA (cytosine-5)-methyltransferase 1
MLQVDELRAAMGFPREHVFNHGSRRDRIKMIGNAVAPPVMGAIIEALCETGSRRKRSVTNGRYDQRVR